MITRVAVGLSVRSKSARTVPPQVKSLGAVLMSEQDRVTRLQSLALHRIERRLVRLYKAIFRAYNHPSSESHPWGLNEDLRPETFLNDFFTARMECHGAGIAFADYDPVFDQAAAVCHDLFALPLPRVRPSLTWIAADNATQIPLDCVPESFWMLRSQAHEIINSLVKFKAAVLAFNTLSIGARDRCVDVDRFSPAALAQLESTLKRQPKVRVWCNPEDKSFHLDGKMLANNLSDEVFAYVNALAINYPVPQTFSQLKGTVHLLVEVNQSRLKNNIPAKISHVLDTKRNVLKLPNLP